MLFDRTLRDILRQSKTVAVIGAKDKPGSPVDRVGRYMLDQGYELWPVHPVRKSAWGIPAVKSLADLPGVPDIVCLFRAAIHCPAHAREVLALPARPLLFWMQEGIWSPEAWAILAGTGIRVVEDLCLMIEHRRLFGGQNGLTLSMSDALASCTVSVPLTASTGLGGLVSNAGQTSTDDLDRADEIFACHRCGKCCEGKGGIVVGPRDLPRLAAHVGLSAHDFLDRFTEPRQGKPALICGADGYCVFFRAGEGCAVHPARPCICRAWPYFRGNLVDEASFFMAREDCPGISRDARHEDFARQGFTYLRDHELVARDPSTEPRALVVREEDLPPRPPFSNKGAS